MRHVIMLGLSLCVAGSAAAQTDVIIRRPGEKDQVIHLDSARTREALAKARVELRQATTAIYQRMQEMQGKLGELRLTEEPLRLNTLALRSGRPATESLIAPMTQRFATLWRQPHLGVLVATTPRETDKYGAYISAVTPGSPADKAGILSGDIIVRIAGKSVVEKDPKDDSGPGVRLISLIATLTVGKPVDVELRRGTQSKTVKVTPIEDEMGTMARMAPSVAEIARLPLDHLNQAMLLGGEWPGRVAMPESRSRSFSIFGDGTGAFSYAFGSNGLFASYELAPLNEKLGAYFGTSEGVLVVNTNANRDLFGDAGPAIASTARAGAAPRGSRDTASVRGGGMTCDTTSRAAGTTIRCRGTGSTEVTTTDIEGMPGGFARRRTAPVNIGLEPGDVIVSVDGRKVSSPSQLMRIVGSYDHNDEFKLQIMRQKRAETLNVKMP